jgi:hypothetical protein
VGLPCNSRNKHGEQKSDADSYPKGRQKVQNYYVRDIFLFSVNTDKNQYDGNVKTNTSNCGSLVAPYWEAAQSTVLGSPPTARVTYQ